MLEKLIDDVETGVEKFMSNLAILFLESRVLNEEFTIRLKRLDNGKLIKQEKETQKSQEEVNYGKYFYAGSNWPEYPWSV